MNTTDSPSLRELFEAALAQPPEDRAAYVAAHCQAPAQRARLLRLLAADHEPGEPLPAGEAVRLAEAIGDADDTPSWQPGQRIGPYELREALGEGGSAAVFRAWRDLDGARQEVALKLLRRSLHSPEARRLFRRERQALAALSHPDIAHLIDGGIGEGGQAYLAMEFVDGESITDFATRGCLNLRQRLHLMIRICRAVAVAHRSLIVHRDLKPSNILVTADGRVKLLDFGIAKLLDGEAVEDDEETRTGWAALTPGYAAPEQYAGGPVSTATDVYALGVVLHELLLGERPGTGPQQRASYRVVDTAKGTRTRPTLPPAMMRHALRGDLDNILLKALAEEPERRYAAAAELADDLERHLRAEPVRAHPPSTWYRTRKFIQRHRGGVALTTAFAIGVLASLGLALWQANIARQEAMRANAVRDFVVGVFDAARASLPRDQSATPQILAQQAQARLASLTDIDSATRADMQQTLGEVWLSLSDFSAAEHSFAQALSIAERRGDRPLVQTLQVLLADGWQRAGRDADAIRQISAVLDDLRRWPRPITLRALHVLAAANRVAGDPDVVLQLEREAAALAADLYPPGSIEALSSALEVGNALASLQRFPEAIAVLIPLLEQWRTSHPVEDHRYVIALGNLVVANDALGQYGDVEAHLRDLLALKRRIYPAAHDSIAKTLRDLAQVVARSPDIDQAHALFNEALAMQRQVLGENHREVVATLDGLGVLMVSQRRFDDADSHYLAAIAICEQAGIRDEACPRARNNLGMSYYRRLRFDDAEREMNAALAERRRLFGEEHATVAYSLATLANVAASRGEYEESARRSVQALSLLERIGHAGSREAALVRNGYAQALHLLDDSAQALDEIDQALAQWQTLVPDGHARRVMMLVLKAQILRDLNRTDEVRTTVEAALALAVPADALPPRTRELLRELSGRDNLDPDSHSPSQSPH